MNNYGDFTQYCYASVGTSCDPVTVRLSVTSRCSIKTAELIELGFGTRVSFDQSYVVRKFRYRRKFCHSTSIIETCYQLSSRNVDTQNVINWTIVGQLSRLYLRAPTLDHYSLSHRSSSAVYSTILSHGSVSDS